MTDKSSSEPESTSPWSGEVPVPNAPVEFTWAATDDQPGSPPGSSGSTANGPSTAQSVGAGNVGGAGGVASSRDQDRRGRQRSLVVAGIGAVLLLTVGWLAFGRGDDAVELDAATDDSLPVETAVEDSLPTVDEPADTEPDDPEGAGTGTGGAAAGAETDVAEWRQDSVELPSALVDSSVAFDIVAVTSNGDYVEVEPPHRARSRSSGR